MHIYKIGYTTTEGDGDFFQLTHENDFSPAELDELIASVLPDAARQWIAELREREQERGKLPPDLFDQHFIPRVRFMDIYRRVTDLLIERHGFAKLAYSGTCMVFGMPDLLVRGDWEGDPAGNEVFQAHLSDILADAGLPVVTLAEREAQEEAKMAVLTPLRLKRRAERAVARMRASGHNPLKTIDPPLAIAVLAEAAGRDVTAEERRLLDEILPDLLDAEPPVEELLSSLATHPELTDLCKPFAAYFPFRHPAPTADAVESDPGTDAAAQTDGAEPETAAPDLPNDELVAIDTLLAQAEPPTEPDPTGGFKP